MASKAWASIERAVAKMVGGERTWNSPDYIDVIESETGYCIEVKNHKGITVAQIEQWIAHNEKKAEGRQMKAALVVKRRAGRGAKTPFLVIFRLTEPEPDIE